MRSGNEIAAAALAQETWPLIGGTTACLNFVTWMADKAGTGYTNANDAWADQRNSHHPTSETPPIGAVGFFGGGPNGDVAIRIPGSLWRSVNADPTDLHCVSQTTAAREKSTGNTYKGWLGGLGGEAISFTSTAGLDTELIEDDPKDYDMKLIKHPNGQPALVDVGAGTFLQISAWTANDLVPTYGPIISVTDSSWTFQAQVAAANRAALSALGTSATVDVQAVAAAVEARLADDFAKVNANIDDQPTEFMIAPK